MILLGVAISAALASAPSSSFDLISLGKIERMGNLFGVEIKQLIVITKLAKIFLVTLFMSIKSELFEKAFG